MKFNKKINNTIFFVQLALVIIIRFIFIDYEQFYHVFDRFWRFLIIMESGFIASNLFNKPALFKSYDSPFDLKTDARTLLLIRCGMAALGIVLVGTETLILTIPLLAVELVRTVIVHISCKS